MAILCLPFAYVLVYGQEIKIESNKHYTKGPDRKETFEIQIVRIYGPKIDREFTLGKDSIELVGGRFPFDIEHQQNLACEIVPEQSEQLKLIEIAYSQRMKDAILNALPSNGDDIDEKTRKSLLKQLRALHAEKEKEEAKVWLPHQNLIRQQVRRCLEFESKPFAVIQGESIRRELGLTESQLKSLKEISEELKDSIANMDRESKARVKEELENRNQKVFELLDSVQKTKLNKMLGPD